MGVAQKEMTEGPTHIKSDFSVENHPMVASRTRATAIPASENEATEPGEELLWPWCHRLSPSPLPLLAMNQSISLTPFSCKKGTSPVLSEQQTSEDTCRIEGYRWMVGVWSYLGFLRCLQAGHAKDKGAQPAPPSAIAFSMA